MPQFSRLLLFHALRPDRLTAAMSKFVSDTLGAVGGMGWCGGAQPHRPVQTTHKRPT